MSLTKILASDYAGKDIAGLDARPNMTAATLQARFDKLVKEVVEAKFNALIDALVANSGGSEIGCTVTDMAGNNVRALIAELSANKAPLASPALTGTPTSTTPLTSDDSAKIATTEFVQDVVAGAVFDAGAADMTKNVYDTGNKVQDIFTYADTAGKCESYSASLTVAGWTLSNGVYTQSVTVTGLKTSGRVYLPSPAYASVEAYGNASIKMKDVTTANTAEFVAAVLPSAAISVNILGVKI